MEIVVYMDHVVIEGQTVKRPSYIPRKQWLDVWESNAFLLGCKRKDCAHYTSQWTGNRS